MTARLKSLEKTEGSDYCILWWVQKKGADKKGM